MLPNTNLHGAKPHMVVVKQVGRNHTFSADDYRMQPTSKLKLGFLEYLHDDFLHGTVILNTEVFTISIVQNKHCQTKVVKFISMHTFFTVESTVEFVSDAEICISYRLAACHGSRFC